MKLAITKRAAKDLGSLPAKTANSIWARLEEVAADPFAIRPNVERLKGEVNVWRIRVAEWRAVYVVDAKTGTITVELIAHRSSVYKRLKR